MFLSSVFLTCALIGANPPASYTGLIWISADECGPCRRMEPLVNEMIVAGEPILIVKVKDGNELFSWGARVTPSTLTVENGQVKYCNRGILERRMMRHLVGLARGEKP